MNARAELLIFFVVMGAAWFAFFAGVFSARESIRRAQRKQLDKIIVMRRPK